jgi:hypothetical protein
METKCKFARRYDAELKQKPWLWVGPVAASWKSAVIWAAQAGHWVNAAKNGAAQTEPKTLAAESPEQRELRRLKQEDAYLYRQGDI